MRTAKFPRRSCAGAAAILGFLSALSVTAAIYGAIPFLAVPTLGQAVWTSGFAQSFVNSGWPAIFATNFGYPNPAPIAFGLSGAFVESALIALADMCAADAYSLMSLLYLGLALWGALKYAQALGLAYWSALAAATVWMSSPMIWAHAGYSMLSLGIAMLPLYLWSGLLLCQPEPLSRRQIAARAIGFIVTATLAVFMDGYTYVMFVVGAAIQFAFALGRAKRSLGYRRLLAVSLPVFAAGIFISHRLYQSYVGSIAFAASSLDFFRSWGSDVTMLLAPTKGLLWLWDTLGVGVTRSRTEYFGDESVWITTFSVILIVAGYAGFRLSRDRRHAYPLLIVALFGTYMSLGPSLKVHAVRPQHSVQAGDRNSLMPADMAVVVTGSAPVSENLPGFDNMRASYRWMALGLAGFWGLYVLLTAELKRRGRHAIAALLALLIIIANLPRPDVRLMFMAGPHIPVRLRAPLDWRAAFKDIDENLLPSLRHQIRHGSVVAFMPRGNDFLANYLSAAGDFTTYNIGGDKNIEMAKDGWPDSIRDGFAAGEAELAAHISEILLRGDADYVVIPFVDLLWHAHEWPPQAASVQLAQQTHAAILKNIESNQAFKVIREHYFAVISLKGISRE